MFDAVTNEALRLRRIRGTRPPVEPKEPEKRTALICSVCDREMHPGEPIKYVGHEVHCSQCHEMLEYELEKEREQEEEVRALGTKWEAPKDEGGEE
jgi:hypothetical protein